MKITIRTSIEAGGVVSQCRDTTDKSFISHKNSFDSLWSRTSISTIHICLFKSDSSIFDEEHAIVADITFDDKIDIFGYDGEWSSEFFDIFHSNSFLCI